MHYNSNKIIYVVALCAFIIMTGFLVGHMLKSDSFQSIYTNDDYLANMYNANANKEATPTVSGDTENFLLFSIWPGSRVHGIKNYKGKVKGGYFFEANILVNILDANGDLLKPGHATATSEWMTSGPVSFEGSLNFNNLPKGPAYIEIHNDNASGLPENDKSIFIPVIIE
jgi:hypothetical protein